MAFLISTVTGVLILVMRQWIPESPRWLITHGFIKEAQAIVDDIDTRVAHRPPAAAGKKPCVRLRICNRTPLPEVARVLLRTYRGRTLIGLALMVAQAFFYNAIFFTYALVLTKFYGISPEEIGWYVPPFAAGNVLGPILLGRLFGTIGRKSMIASTYATSAVLLAATGYLFSQNLLSAQTLTTAWMVVFFFASAAASSAYLTVSEIFPLETRALAIAFFYAIGTAVAGAAGPLLLGILISTGSRASVALGYLIGSLLMIVAAAVEALWGVDAERKPLEAVAQPCRFVEVLRG